MRRVEERPVEAPECALSLWEDPPQQPRCDERRELLLERPGEARVVDDDAGLDVPRVGRLGEVGRGDEGGVAVDDDALGVDDAPLVGLRRQGARVVVELGLTGRGPVLLQELAVVVPRDGVGVEVRPARGRDVQEEEE